MSVRVGVRLPGPFWVSFGGHRHRRVRRSAGGHPGWAIFFGLVAVALAVTYWYVTVPVVAVVILLALAAHHGKKIQAREAAAISARQPGPGKVCAYCKRPSADGSPRCDHCGAGSWRVRAVTR